MAPIKIKTWSI